MDAEVRGWHGFHDASLAPARLAWQATTSECCAYASILCLCLKPMPVPTMPVPTMRGGMLFQACCFIAFARSSRPRYVGYSCPFPPFPVCTQLRARSSIPHSMAAAK